MSNIRYSFSQNEHSMKNIGCFFVVVQLNSAFCNRIQHICFIRRNRYFFNLSEDSLENYGSFFRVIKLSKAFCNIPQYLCFIISVCYSFGFSDDSLKNFGCYFGIVINSDACSRVYLHHRSAGTSPAANLDILHELNEKFWPPKGGTTNTVHHDQ